MPRVIVDFDGSLFAALSSARYVDVFARNKIGTSHFRAAASRRDGGTGRGRKAGADDLKKSSGTAAPGEKSYRRFTSLTRDRPAGRRERAASGAFHFERVEHVAPFEDRDFYRRTRVKLEPGSVI